MLVEARRAKRSPWVAAAKAVIASAARRRVFDRMLGSAAGPWVERARTSAGFVSQYGHLYQIFGPDGAARLLGTESRKRVASGRSLDEDLRRLDELPNSPSLDRVTALCLRGYTNNQLLRDIDAVSMAHSLEVRVPYLDTAIVDIALSLPEAARLDFRGDGETGGGTSYRATGAKRVLIDVARPFLSAGFDDQPKRGFAMPFEAWLRGPLRDVLVDVLSEATVGARGILDPAEVRRVRDAFLQGTGGWAQPWTLMMLELWCLEVLDGPRVAAAA
jgi:asparagine synthase (glutamine-hydrolysing)